MEALYIGIVAIYGYLYPLFWSTLHRYGWLFYRVRGIFYLSLKVWQNSICEDLVFSSKFWIFYLVEIDYTYSAVKSSLLNPSSRHLGSGCRPGVLAATRVVSTAVSRCALPSPPAARLQPAAALRRAPQISWSRFPAATLPTQLGSAGMQLGSSWVGVSNWSKDWSEPVMLNDAQPEKGARA